MTFKIDSILAKVVQPGADERFIFGYQKLKGCFKLFSGVCPMVGGGRNQDPKLMVQDALCIYDFFHDFKPFKLLISHWICPLESINKLISCLDEHRERSDILATFKVRLPL